MSSPLTKTSVQDGIKEYPNHHFACVKGKLRCHACCKIVAVKEYVRSQKHLNGITNVKKDKAKSQSIEQCLYLNAVLPCYYSSAQTNSIF